MLTTPEPAWGSEVNKDTLSVKRYQFAGVRYENKQCHVYCHKFLCVAPRARAAQLCYKGGNFFICRPIFSKFSHSFVVPCKFCAPMQLRVLRSFKHGIDYKHIYLRIFPFFSEAI